MSEIERSEVEREPAAEILSRTAAKDLKVKAPLARGHMAAGPVSRILYPAFTGRRSFLWDAHYCAPQATYPELVRAEPARAGIAPGLAP